MARTKLIPDSEVLAIALKILLIHGEKSVTFSAVSQKCRLASPTLVQRFGTCAAMIDAALSLAWVQLEAQTATAFSDTTAKGKGVQAVLKALSGPIDSPALVATSLKYPRLTLRATAWRAQVEAGLAQKLGMGAKAQEAASLTFAAWQGRLLWDGAGGKGFRMGEALKKLT